jgi:hypothetical protein
MKRTVKVLIEKDGAIRVDLSGFIGDDCLIEGERLKGILDELGLELKGEVERKPDHEMPYEVKEEHDSGHIV